MAMKRQVSIIVIFFLAEIISLKSQDVFWADTIFSCSSEITNESNSPIQVLGKYNVMPNFGKTPCAWTLVYAKRRNQWIELGFAKNIIAQQVIINENYNYSAIAKVILFDEKNNQKIVFSNPDPKMKSDKGRFFNIIFKNDDFIVSKVRIELNTSNFWDDYQIDAVGITEKKDTIFPQINLEKSSEYQNNIERLNDNVNSNYSDLAPLISPDGKILFFTREGDPRNLGGANDQDIWYSIIDSNGIFEKAENIGPPLNNAYSNFAISVTPDGNSLIVGNIYTQNEPPMQGVSISHLQNDKWNYPEPLKINNYYNKSRYSTFYYANDSKTLLFGIVRDDSYGSYDLYVSFLQSDGSWSEPKNLGPEINTAGDELSPFLASDLATLYFSSNSYPGYGKNDIFMSRRLDSTWEHWSEPINLGNQINTPEWDAYFSVPASGEYAYLVSYRDGIYREDIYRIKLPQSLKPESVVLISGKVLNSKTNAPILAKIVYEELPQGKEVGTAISNDSTGEYKITLPGNKKYGFRATAEGFLGISENIDLTNLVEYQELKRDLYLVPVQKGAKFLINNIFFEFGKFNLLPESYPELNRLAEFLKKNPEIRIKISGYTDNIGSTEDNQILSQKRADAVREYLISKGIEVERITTLGYGEKDPIATNKTEKGRALNRRVEFEISEDTK
jgi:outer membrane protein OmpA-like peptidoglycan-associated protein